MTEGAWMKKKKERRNKIDGKTHLKDRKTRKWNTMSFSIYNKPFVKENMIEIIVSSNN
jgi:hypothetical protein